MALLEGEQYVLTLSTVSLRTHVLLVPWKVPGMPTAIENIILRYIKSKADWWCSYVVFIGEIPDKFSSTPTVSLTTIVNVFVAVPLSTKLS